MSKTMRNSGLDSFDAKILSILQADGRITNHELGERVGLSSSSCHRRVKALEEEGVIDGYRAIVKEEAVGLTLSVFVQITLKNQNTDILDVFEKAVCGHKEIMECYLMSGQFDYLLRVVARNSKDYERIHNHVLTRLPGVDRVVTSFAIRNVSKRTDLPL